MKSRSCFIPSSLFLWRCFCNHHSVILSNFSAFLFIYLKYPCKCNHFTYGLQLQSPDVGEEIDSVFKRSSRVDILQILRRGGGSRVSEGKPGRGL
ncbi:hypothetical protein TIFTF001_004166 [Ficus carica]|uniref:Uncharacterized protein n=1 Tax=Ficus carica TaxID=3494 RepID=A0AA88DCA2_FICCA|nr:hypothetical protein TIFTF001_004166 [Ficus carica]